MSSDAVALQAVPRQPVNGLVHRRRLLVPLAIFLVLEAGFIALAITCLVSPSLCPLPASSTLTGPTLTILFIIWHSFAVMNAQRIVLHGFGAEWYIQYKTTGVLTPGRTDAVSTITTGILARIRHFFRREASPSYRISFLAFWLLIMLATLAPGVIKVDNLPKFAPMQINITNFTVTGGDVVNVLTPPVVRASTIADFELRENTSFGFATQEHMITGWPNIQPDQLTDNMEYDSDVLFYDTKCQWEAPSFNLSKWNTTWYAGGYAWYPWILPLTESEFEGGILPMYRFSTDQDFVADSFPIPLNAVNPVGMSGYIFYGRNSSFPNKPSKNRNLNLGGLPTVHNSSGFQFIGYDGSDAHFKSPLVTFLLCDPQAQILGGRVSITQANTSLNVISTSPPDGGTPKIGNIPLDAANIALGFGLLEMFISDDLAAAMQVGEPAARAFLNDSSLNFTSTPTNHFDVGIVSIPTIQQNLNLYTRSASKALSTYFRDYDNVTADQLFLVPVEGTIRDEQLALVTSKALLIPAICLFAGSACALLIEVFYLRIGQLPAFSLKALVSQGMDSSKLQRSSSRENVPPGQKSRPRMLTLSLRLLTFIILEGLFLSPVLISFRELLFINASVSSVTAQGGFTIILILWQVIAVSVLYGGVSFAFSIEWSLHKASYKFPITGFADRTSRLTSGFYDRSRHFLTTRPSVVFRIAFLNSLILAALFIIAPTALSVVRVLESADMPLRVADLRLLNSSAITFDYVFFLKQRASSMIQLEQFEGSTIKYKLPPNWVIALPEESSIEPNIAGGIVFPTDVVRFNYSCTWKAPEMSFDGNWTEWKFSNQTWQLSSEPIPDMIYQGGILPLFRFIDTQPDPTSAFLFVGTNDSFPVNSDKDKRSIINLNNLPTLVHSKGFINNVSGADPSLWISSLSTVLHCDPHIDVSGGLVQISKRKELKVVASGLPIVGNLPDQAVVTIFTEAFPYALDTDDETAPQWLGSTSAAVFLTDASLNFDAFPHGIPVLDETTISGHLNTYLLSASKAFTDGLYFPPANQTLLSTQTRNVTGRAEITRQAVVGDKQLGIASLSLACASALLFASLMYLFVRSAGVPFDLKHTLHALGTQTPGSEAASRP